MSYVALVPPIYYNVQQYGATGNGTSDDTSAIAAAITAAVNAGNGTVFFPAGNYKITSPLTLSNPYVVLKGSGPSSTITAGSTFSGAQMIICSTNFTGISDLVLTGGPNTTYTTNPATNGIQVTGSVGTLIQNVAIYYVNGWAVQSTATATQANFGTNLINVHSYGSKQGIHVLGVSGSSYEALHYLTNCNVDGNTQGGDCYLFEDAYDVVCANIYATLASTGNTSAIHIKGKCASVNFANIDLGLAPSPASCPVVLIESGTNGSPTQCVLRGGIIQGGTTGVSISAGSQIILESCNIYNNGTYGVNITGGDSILLRSCIFNANGASGTTGRYDFQSSTTGNVDVSECHFLTPQGSTAQHTNNVINATGGGGVLVQNCRFGGTGYAGGNIFAGYPSLIRNCKGYNPLGPITAPTIGASPFTSSVSAQDYTVHVSGGTVSSIAIGGTATGLTAGTFRVPAGQTITLTYTVAPTWVWIGD